MAETYLDLIARLREYLSKDNYTEFQVTNIPEVGRLYQIMTKRRWAVRYVCVTLEVSETVKHDVQCKDLFDRIRAFLSEQYARFPWWKELGTFSVLLCSHELYEQLKERKGGFRDSSGLHINVMLGTVFVDRDQFESSSVKTWGLWYSGQNFEGIKRAVHEWCKQNRGEQKI